MEKWTKFDQIAWEQIKERKPRPWLPGWQRVTQGRPRSFAEFEQFLQTSSHFDMVFDSFLDEFYFYKVADFFAHEPPTSLSPQQRAWLAATADFLSSEFELPHPAWVDKPEYTLSEWYDPYNFGLPPEQTNSSFARHGVLFQTRSLIRV